MCGDICDELNFEHVATVLIQTLERGGEGGGGVFVLCR